MDLEITNQEEILGVLIDKRYDERQTVHIPAVSNSFEVDMGVRRVGEGDCDKDIDIDISESSSQGCFGAERIIS